MKQGGHLLQHIDQGSTGKQFKIGQYLIITGTPCMNLFTGFPTLSGEEAFYLRMDVLYIGLKTKAIQQFNKEHDSFLYFIQSDIFIGRMATGTVPRSDLQRRIRDNGLIGSCRRSVGFQA